MTSAYSLSIVVPSYSRGARLIRSLSYLIWLAKHQPHIFDFTKIMGKLELLIADGTPENQQQTEKASLVNLLKSPFLLKYFNASIFFLPEQTYFQRLNCLAQSANSKYIMMVGDEDLVVFDPIPQILSLLNSTPDTVAVAGIFLDIKGFSRGKLRIIPEESWLNGGIDIIGENPLLRWTMYRFQCQLGAPSITYSIMRSFIFKEYTSSVTRQTKKLSHATGEQLLNCLMLCAGHVRTLNVPLVLRDFTMSMHNSSSDYSQPGELWHETAYSKKNTTDCLAQALFDKGLFSSYLLACNYVDDSAFSTSHSTWSYCQSYAIACERKYPNSVLPELKFHTLKAAHYAWSTTLKACYQADEISVGSSALFSLRGLVKWALKDLRFFFNLLR